MRASHADTTQKVLSLKSNEFLSSFTFGPSCARSLHSLSPCPYFILFLPSRRSTTLFSDNFQGMSVGLPPRRWMTPPPIYETTQQQGPTLKPYLTLPYLLSLTWLAYPIISLLFIAFRLALSSQSAEDGVADAKSQLLASCAAAEKAATVAASLPRYMAIGTNEQIASAVNASMNAAREALVLALTILEAIINFAIDIYRSTFFCFLELVVRGGLSILIEAVQDVSHGVLIINIAGF